MLALLFHMFLTLQLWLTEHIRRVTSDCIIPPDAKFLRTGFIFIISSTGDLTSITGAFHLILHTGAAAGKEKYI